MLHLPQWSAIRSNLRQVMKKIVAYYRVSTKRQGQSGLGLDGQKVAVEAYAVQEGATIIGTYTEIETGKRSDRPALARAIAHSRLAKGKLVVAKLDRLARNVAFTSALMESKVQFVAADNQHANEFTIHILAAVAEHEAKAISERTKTALKAAKARGTKLGSARPGHWDGREEQRTAGQKLAVKSAAQSRSRAARRNYEFIVPEIVERRARGESLRNVAAYLNELGQSTSTGKPWTAMAVMRVARMAAEAT